jgi:hypothetical protein
MDIDYEFLKSLALVLIPIGTGALVTRYVTNYWQTTKEKLEIKRKILSDYQESYKRQSGLLDEFMFRVFEEYLVQENSGADIPIPEYDDKERKIESFLQFPSNIDGQPKMRFSSEHKKLLQNIDKAVDIGNRFLSSTRLYHAESTLERQLRELEDKFDTCELIIQRFMISKNGNKFLESYEMYKKVSDEIIEDIKKIELELVELKLQFKI